jgi:RNA-directed DNA polymerase
MVVVLSIESLIEPHFHENSYAYQKNKSAHDAIAKARERCYTFHWVIDLDISKFFDTIDHELLFKALKKHVSCKWALLYIRRWLAVPYQLADGSQVQRDKGVPQGSVIGPMLANLFLHYAFDEWMKRHYAHIAFERYADDIICHCVSLKQAEFIKRAIQKRLADCKLELNEGKTKIVYCKKNQRDVQHNCIQFDFLGYTFKPRRAIDKNGVVFLNFTPAISQASKKKIWTEVRKWNRHYWVQLTLEQIAGQINSTLQGWINYYGRHHIDVLKKTLIPVNMKLVRWIRDKYKGFRKHKTRAVYRLGDMALANPDLFAHWKWGVRPTASPQNRKVKLAE